VKPWRDDARRGPGSLNGAPGEGRSGAGSSDLQRHGSGDRLLADLVPDPTDREGVAAPRVGIVGAGPVGTALGLAISRAGWPVAAVASRDAGRRERFLSLVPTARAFIEPAAVLDEVELAILAVPDDAIAEVIAPLRLYSGQALIHTSGVLDAEVLQSALAAGSQIGAFHPLVSFTSDVERSVAAIAGATIALEGDDRLMGLLADLAEAIGGVPVRLPRGAKAAYHAAAALASGGLVALLDAIVQLGAAAGLDERGAVAIYGRLMEQTLANARDLGVAASLTGPVFRGDAGTIEAHLAAVGRVAPDVRELYLAAARREVQIAQERRTLSPEQLERVRRALAKVG
jgi:predicted short-subunit dehydrogenase-like oxidoreductase (DUF2520 family)